MSIELKIKVKNLADEARTIRVEENKLHGMAKWNLQHHRKTVVRDAARRSQMAYQIVRGRDWRDCASHDDQTRMSDFKEVSRMVKKYGSIESVLSLPKIEAAKFVQEERDDDQNNNALLGNGERRCHRATGDRQLQDHGRVRDSSREPDREQPS